MYYRRHRRHRSSRTSWESRGGWETRSDWTTRTERFNLSITQFLNQSVKQFFLTVPLYDISVFQVRRVKMVSGVFGGLLGHRGTKENLDKKEVRHLS